MIVLLAKIFLSPPLPEVPPWVWVVTLRSHFNRRESEERGPAF